MRNNPMSSDITDKLKKLENRIRTLETKQTGTIYVDKQIIVEDPETGVKTVIGDLSDYGEGSGVKEWIGDTTPPPVPTEPIAVPSPGLISVAWDGATASGEPQAPDFDHIKVFGLSDNSMRLVGVVKTSDEIAIIADAEKGSTWNFYFRSVDKNGNESELSLPTPMVIAQGITDFKEASAPSGLSFSLTKEFDALGKDYASVQLNWNAVTTATDGYTAEIDGYEIWGSENGSAWKLITGTTGTTVRLTLDAGSTWKFKVRGAVTSSTLLGPFSTEITVDVLVDSAAPPVATKPVVTHGAGSFSVSWDGTNVASAPIPADFERLDVFGSNGTKTERIGVIRYADEPVVFTKGVRGETWDFWFAAVDKRGNTSAISAKSTGHKVDSTLPDLREAQAPANLAQNSVLKTNPAGQNYTETTASWTAVTKATDGSTLPIVGYELWGKEGTGAWAVIRTLATTSAVLTLDSGSSWTLKVRAISSVNAIPGQFSSDLAFTAVSDTTPPPIPSMPLVTARDGFFSVVWDGTNVGSAPIPTDFDRINVHASNGTTSKVIGAVRQVNDAIIFSEGLPAETWSFWFVALDKSKNPSAASASSTGHKVVDTLPDERTPAAPTGLTHTSSLMHNSSGRPFARVTLSWTAVTKATDGSNQTMRGYQVWGAEGSGTKTLVASVSTASAVVDINAGSTWKFAVRAVAAKSPSDGTFSTERTVVAPADTTAPPVPSTPTLTTWLRTVTAKWDGLPAMPVDFSHINVYVNNILVDRMGGTGTWTSSTMPADVAVSVQFASVDTSGNISAKSATATITPRANVDLSQIADKLDAATLTLKNLGLGEISPGATLNSWVTSANTQLGTLDSNLSSLGGDLDAAKARITEAEEALSPMSGALETAQETANNAVTAAQNAADAALAAQSAAVEANNRAMTRLANGSFEQDFEYWQRDQMNPGNGTLPVITADSYGGGKAARFVGVKSAEPSTGLPVVENQIWELSMHVKAPVGTAGQFEMHFDGHKDSEGVRKYLVGTSKTVLGSSATGDWSLVVQRITVPADVSILYFRLLGRTGGDWTVDEVSLRDVSDVVRLEQAAQAAVTKAEKAEADAKKVADDLAVLQLVQGGIRTELDAAKARVEEVASEAADALSDLDEALTNAFQQGDQSAQEAASTAMNSASAAQTAAAEAKEAAVAAALLRIDSSKGSVFKNNSISTVLSATIFYAGQTITDISTLHEALGPTAYLEWFWRRDSDADFGLISSSDNRLSNAGFSLTVSPADVDEKAVFQCYLNV